MEKFIGDSLRKEREAKNLSLTDIAQDIKIREKYLQALEDENYEIFPAEVYLTGFLSTYTKYLGLDVDTILRQYRQIRKEKEEKYLDKSKENLLKNNEREKRSFYQEKAIVILIVILGAIIFFLPFFLKRLKANRKTISEKGLYKEGFSLQRKVKVPEKIYLEIKGRKATWIRIMGDEKLIYEGLIKEDEVKVWEAKETFKVKIKDIYNIEVKFNGKPIDISSGQQGKVNEIVLKRRL